MSSYRVPDVGVEARKVYGGSIVVDMHNDLPSRILDDGYDPDVRHPHGFGPGLGQTDLPRLIESGITAQFLAAWVDAPYARDPGASFARAMASIETIHSFIGRHPEHLRLATRASHVREAKETGRTAILIGVEGGHAIEHSLDRLRTLRNYGASYLTFTWNNGIPWAGSSIGLEGTRKGGLTEFGREVVREMNRIGMIVDVSHVSDATFDDVLGIAGAPLIASHSSARAINDAPRNLDDRQLRDIAANGGVAAVNFYSRFIDPEFKARVEQVEIDISRARRAALLDPECDSDELRTRLDTTRRRLLHALPPAPFDRLIDHFEHIARVAGIEHVGIGSDFDGVAALPQGMEDVTCMPRIAQALLERGWPPSDIGLLLGGNMMRVMQAVLG